MSSLDDLASAAVADATALYSEHENVRAILQRRYSEDATFDDGAVSVKGHPGTLRTESSFFLFFLSSRSAEKPLIISFSFSSPFPLPPSNADILVQFAALGFFPQVSVVPVASSGGQNEGQQPKLFEVKTTSLPGKALVEFRNTQSFSLPFSLTTITLAVDTQLELDAQGKITKHCDRWRTLSVGGGALAVPAPTMPRLLRRGLGSSTSLAMRLAGVGKGESGNGCGSGGEAQGAGGVTGRVAAMLRGEKAD